MQPKKPVKTVVALLFGTIFTFSAGLPVIGTVLGLALIVTINANS
jgi:hypothetical protein